MVDVRQNTVGISTISRMVMEEARWGVVSPGSERSIPTIRADFLCFTSSVMRRKRTVPHEKGTR
jgi:hypothetical protein